jgi:hypothetical protein
VRDRPEAACPHDCRLAVGAAGGFNAVQKLLTTTSAATLSPVERVAGIEAALSAWELTVSRGTRQDG